jgi:hypothetical protein
MTLLCHALLSGFIACYQGASLPATMEMVCTDDPTIAAAENVEPCPSAYQPVEHGMDCWHSYDVPSYDNPDVTKRVRIWQCEPTS